MTEWDSKKVMYPSLISSLLEAIPGQINGGGKEKSTYIWLECCWQQFYACQDEGRVSFQQELTFI